MASLSGFSLRPVTFIKQCDSREQAHKAGKRRRQQGCVKGFIPWVIGIRSSEGAFVVEMYVELSSWV